MRRTNLLGAACRRGIASIEFALVAPVLILMMAGVFEFGALIRAQTAAHRLAMQYAYSFANCPDTYSGACQWEILTHEASATLANVAPQLVPSQLSLVMFQVKMNGSSPTVEYQNPVWVVLTSAQIASLQSVVPSGQTGVVVAVAYRHSLIAFPNIMTSLIGQDFTTYYSVVQLK